MSISGARVMAATVVAVDVGKHTAMLSVTNAARRRLLGPVEFAMTAAAVAAVVQRVCAVVPAAAVKVGVVAAGHYHRLLPEPVSRVSQSEPAESDRSGPAPAVVQRTAVGVRSGAALLHLAKHQPVSRG
jgi:hypothetical protein